MIKDRSDAKNTREIRFSICIPHYNRWRYLKSVIDSISRQDLKNIEIVISDDNSQDESLDCCESYLEDVVNRRPGITYTYIRQAKNIGYDANLRKVLEIATGDYLFLLGNDDDLLYSDTLSKLSSAITHYNRPELIIGNYFCYRDGKTTSRVRRTRYFSGDPKSALKYFRLSSFVSGIILRKDIFERVNTSKFDGSVYVQMYFVAYIIASGANVLLLAQNIVGKDVLVDGRGADSYADRLKIKNVSFWLNSGGLDQVGIVVSDAICHHSPHETHAAINFQIFLQLLLNSYPYWLFSYRRHRAFKAAVNIALGCNPLRLIQVRPFLAKHWICICTIYCTVTVGALFFPLFLLSLIKSMVYRK